MGALLTFTLERVDLLRQSDQADTSVPQIPGGPPTGARDVFLAFQVNLLVDNAGAEGPPVLTEPNPRWTNLFGKIERRAFMGTYVSDHTMLKPGALHLANGGYIVLSARDLVGNAGRVGRAEASHP